VGRKNHLHIDKSKKSAIALVCGDTQHVITINDEAAIKTLDDLAQRQRQIGIDVSRLLKGHGLMLADDDEETITCS